MLIYNAGLYCRSIQSLFTLCARSLHVCFAILFLALLLCGNLAVSSLTMHGVVEVTLILERKVEGISIVWRPLPIVLDALGQIRAIAMGYISSLQDNQQSRRMRTWRCKSGLSQSSLP